VQAGDLPGAGKVLREAISVMPGEARLRGAFAVVQRAQGLTEDAINSWRAAISLNPQDAESHYDLALTLAAAQRRTEAISYFRRTIELEPAFPDAYLHLAAALQQQGEVAEAIELCRRAVAVDPENPDAHQFLGALLVGTRSLDEAEQHLTAAIQFADVAEDPAAMRRVAWGNLGVAHACRNRVDEALAAYGEVLAIDPEDAEAHWNRSQLLLCLGDFARGWEEYEWRWQAEPLKSSRRHFAAPQWDGSSLAGRTILLHAEQGVGDTIQFVRYAPLLAAQGATVVLQCQPALRSLMSSLAGVSAIVTDGSLLPTFDVHAALLSLPRLCGTLGDEQVPASVPYLHAPRDRAVAWASRLPRTAGRARVGLVWAGNPGHPNDRARSIPLAAFAPLAAMERGIDLYSLQVGAASGQLNSAPFRITDLGRELSDFGETAAVLANLDLLITADTAAAHLAGALGRPTWTLIPFRPDWRWQFDRSDSPWYPTMRLLRQQEIGDWAGPIERVGAELVGQTFLSAQG
jgi:tetratricopeptide (TPR) repeat protein